MSGYGRGRCGWRGPGAGGAVRRGVARGCVSALAAIGGVCVLVLLSAVAVEAQGIFGRKAEPTVSVVDTNELYRVGFLGFEARSLSAELEYLQVSLPRLFSQEFAKIEEHFFNEEELARYGRYLVQREIDAANQQLTTFFAARDQYLFAVGDEGGGGGGGGVTDQRQQQDTQIEDQQQRLVQLAEYDLSEIETEQEKQIEIVNLTGEYTQGRPSYARIVQQHNLDIVFDGLIMQDSEFILVAVRYYERAEGEIHTLETVSVAQDEIDLLSSLINDSLADIIIGRDWSSIVVEGAREQDSIYIDDRLIGYGPQTARYIPLGEYTVSIESEYLDESLEQRITLSERASVTVEFNIGTSEPEYVSIDTFPSAATVYVNATWQGETPLQVERAPLERALLIRKPGYFDVKRALNSETEERLQYTLTPELFDQGIWLLSRRDRFYSALTAFIVSVPIPIILSGIAENSATYRTTNDYRRLSVEQQSTVTITENITQAGGYVGIFASVILAVNAIIEAVHYVNAADFFHRL